MNVWVAEAVSPYHNIMGVFRSLGTAVRAAKRAEPNAEWGRIDHVSFCGGGGYTITGQRKVQPWAYGDCRSHEYVFYRFTRCAVRSAAACTDSKEKP